MTTTGDGSNDAKIVALRGRVLRAIVDAPGGLTFDEIVAKTGLPASAVTPRIIELRRANAIHIWGSRRGKGARRLKVWAVKE